MSESKQEKNQYTSAVFCNSLPSDFFTDSRVAEGVRLITDHGGIKQTMPLFTHIKKPLSKDSGFFRAGYLF